VYYHVFFDTKIMPAESGFVQVGWFDFGEDSLSYSSYGLVDIYGLSVRNQETGKFDVWH
jgi:hypothetical protein